MNYTWNKASGLDVEDIVKMAESHFQTEIDNIFTPDPIAYSRNVTFAIVNQFYLPGTELLTVARNDDNKLLAYTWAHSNERAAWSDDPMLSIRMVHVGLDLSARLRVRLILDMMHQWEEFARFAKMPIICSTTMRHDQDGFLKLHAKQGYDIRGSFAYKKLSTEQTGLPIP